MGGQCCGLCKPGHEISEGSGFCPDKCCEEYYCDVEPPDCIQYVKAVDVDTGKGIKATIGFKKSPQIYCVTFWNYGKPGGVGDTCSVHLHRGEEYRVLYATPAYEFQLDYQIGYSGVGGREPFTACTVDPIILEFKKQCLQAFRVVDADTGKGLNGVTLSYGHPLQCRTGQVREIRGVTHAFKETGGDTSYIVLVSDRKYNKKPVIYPVDAYTWVSGGDSFTGCTDTDDPVVIKVREK